eukprot:TRINITY_DN13990_c0_g1_i4.p1 TRINITY_DN13990_c0_g1~~TRINITY_DN13990_c0_g1_i4.p1  ORF type:complete len:187 (+),score=35.58 TRINITY_DN13990_c0_g1_i4:88-648(+)
MRCERGEQGIQLLLMSDRIQDDLSHYISSRGEQMRLIVREFNQFDVELEFRGFVYNSRLTGLTQYNECVFFPNLVQRKEEVEQSIRSQFETVLMPLLNNHLTNYVVDFILISQTPQQGKYSNLKLYVVEVNPFAEFAGGGMFSWTSDKAVLLGNRPFEFRVRHDVDPLISKSMLPQWRDAIHADQQ